MAGLTQEGKLAEVNRNRPHWSAEWKVLLFLNDDWTEGDNNNFADIDEASFPGYARKALTFGTPAIDGDGEARSASPPAVFTRTGSSGPQTVYGWAVVDESSDSLIAWKLFSSPKVMATEEDVVIVTLTAVMP
jgi:hypothetical protein